MSLFYQTNSWTSQPQVSDETLNLWKHVAKKKNWRIVQLPNGFYQTEYLIQTKKILGSMQRDVKQLKALNKQ